MVQLRREIWRVKRPCLFFSLRYGQMRQKRRFAYRGKRTLDHSKEQPEVAASNLLYAAVG
jgi:hypothetical protein